MHKVGQALLDWVEVCSIDFAVDVIIQFSQGIAAVRSRRARTFASRGMPTRWGVQGVRGTTNKEVMSWRTAKSRRGRAYSESELPKDVMAFIRGAIKINVRSTTSILEQYSRHVWREKVRTRDLCPSQLSEKRKWAGEIVPTGSRLAVMPDSPEKRKVLAELDAKCGPNADEHMRVSTMARMVVEYRMEITGFKRVDMLHFEGWPNAVPFPNAD